MTILELITSLSNFDATSIDMAAKATVESGVPGAKDIFMGWGKSLGVPAKALEEEWKAAQPAKASSGARGFADIYYDWLASSARTEAEAASYIMGDASANVRNHLTHYLNIWALVETVRGGKKVARTIAAGKMERNEKAQPSPEEEWEYNTADKYADIRSAYETLRREGLKNKPNKNVVHPDKVAKFNDEKLSAAYTKAFQVYSK